MKKFLKSMSMMLAILTFVCFIPSPMLKASADELTAETATGKLYKNYSQETMDLIETKANYTQLADYLCMQFKNYAKEIDISKYNVPYSQAGVDLILDIIINYDYELLNVDYTISYWHSGNILTRIVPKYVISKSEYEKRLAQCRAKANEMVADLKNNNNLNVIQKALLIHDRIATLCEYDKENLENDTLPFDVYNIYGVLINNIAVCQGYAETYGYLLDMVGIKSELCSSDQLDHAWNIVYIDGVPYHVDVTWDDPTWDVTGRVNHVNFLISSSAMIDTGHTANDYKTFPTDTRYENSFWKYSNAEFQLMYDGYIYYIDSENEKLKRWDNNFTTIADVADKWPTDGGYWSKHARLSSNGAFLFYSGHDSISIVDPLTGVSSEVYWPVSIGGNYSIYGFTIKNGQFIYDMNNNPLFDINTKRQHEYKAGNYLLWRNVGTNSIEIANYLGEATNFNILSSTSDNVKIIGIGPRAFKNDKHVTTVILQSGHTYIKDEAFANCARLTDIYIPKTVTSIYFSAFGSNPPSSLTIHGAKGSVAHQFANEHNIRFQPTNMYDFEYTDNGGSLTITGYTGSDNDFAIPSYLFSKPVVAIAQNAFANRPGLSSVLIPSTVTNIDMSAFVCYDAAGNYRYFPQNMRMIGDVGSYAQNYANYYGIPFVPLGDVSGNTSIGSEDATLVLQSIAGIVFWNANDIKSKASDVNMDGSTDSIDVTMILQRIAGIIQSFT